MGPQSNILNSFKNLTAVITGVNSTYGSTCAKRLLNKGCRVTGIDQENLDESRLKGVQSHEHFQFIQSDVGNKCQMQSALDETVKKFQKVDILLNCISFGLSSMTYNYSTKNIMTLDFFEETLLANLLGTFNAIRLTAAVMAKNRTDNNEVGGVIINTTSTAAFDASKGQVTFGSMKAALVSMTLPLARDLAPFGIRVVSIAPGLMDVPSITPRQLARQYFPWVNQFPHRLGKAEEFAFAVECAIANPMLNGVNFRVDAAGRLIFT